MRGIFIILLFFFVYDAFGAVEDQETQATVGQTTKLEEFQARLGAVLIRGYTAIGQIRGLGGDLIVEATEYRDASDPSVRVSGIRVRIEEFSRTYKEHTAYIDADEIDALLANMDYLSKDSTDLTKLDQFEAEYATKGDFQLSLSNDNKGETLVAVTCGHHDKSTVYLNLKQFDELKDLIVSAKLKI